MDKIVQAAMQKWPNVPHCYGWLALDARGYWRMRDERAQALQLPGDKIHHAALRAFIDRNYQCEMTGETKSQWYFQNGPQRVYVDLDTTPFIARYAPNDGLVLHTGVALTEINAAYLTAVGNIIFRTPTLLAQLDDRDIAAIMPYFIHEEKTVSDDLLIAWMQHTNDNDVSRIDVCLPHLPTLLLQHAEVHELMQAMGFIAKPKSQVTRT